jgi:hypothetical protein
MAKRRAVSRTAKKRASQAAKRPATSRAKRAARRPDDQSGWPYSQFAVWSQCWGSLHDDNQTRPTTALLRHPATPFMGTGNLDDFEYYLQKVAYAYLATANNNELIDPSLEIPDKWLDGLDPDGPGPDPSVFPPFGWLPLAWPATDQPVSSLISFSALRRNALAPRSQPSEAPSDQIVILLASQKTGFDKDAVALGSQFGIRVVAHVKHSSKSQFEIRISGMSASLPFGIFRTGLLPQSLVRTREARALDAAAFFQSSIDFLTSRKQQFRTKIEQMHGLETGSVAIQGVRLAPILTLSNEFQAFAQVRVSALRKKTKAGVAAASVDLQPYYSFTFATKLMTNDEGEISSDELSLVSKTELMAEARAFPIDPASQKDATEPLHERRPTRREDVLDAYRVPEPTPTLLDYAPGGDDDDQVVVCPGFVFADNSAAPGSVKLVPPGDSKVRSNDASAIMAYWNVEQFFDRMLAYGIVPKDYFLIAPLPLEVHYRSGIRPGPGKDGQTVNAQIRVKGFPDNFEGPIPGGDHPPIEMHLALADLSTRARKPWDGANRSPAEPLGIAADARWIWHEIGHVLLTTSVGELQFRFAHSPGDALAAIVSDPESKLATDLNWRGSTFPWVFLPRRHDRCVLQGWSWSGGLHYALSQVEDVVGPRRKAYWSEQILSSSLFRLYRSIGGDTNTTLVDSTVPDLHARRSASHYCVYLIMRGIQILGASLVSPTNDPDQFVSALIDADYNTASSTPSWQVDFPPVFPPGPPDTFTRIGGCLPKVIRWAFEAQGLYRSFTNAPGYPPPVDIFIADLRPPSEHTPCGDIAYGPGSYNPVSLEWKQNQAPQDPPPQWQADPAAISISGNGEISVIVGNRGTAAATNVEVSMWWQKWPGPAPVPQWDVSAWTPCALMGPSATQTILPSGQATFGPFAAVPLPVGTNYLLLAQATCPDDRPNIDPATGSPCSQKPTPLIDLVPNDNNLGLRVLKR